MAKELILLAALAIATPAQAQLVEQVDLKKPERPEPDANSAMVVLRAHASTIAGDNRILLHRYDPATGKVVNGADGKAAGAKLTYSYTLFGGAKGEKALRVAIVPAGDYVLAGRTLNLNYTDMFCFGAPRFTVKAGEIVYIGDYEMFGLAKMPDGERRNAMRYSADVEGARTALAGAYPALAAKLTAWTPVNGATFACSGDEFTAYAIPSASPAGGDGAAVTASDR